MCSLSKSTQLKNLYSHENAVMKNVYVRSEYIVGSITSNISMTEGQTATVLLTLLGVDLSQSNILTSAAESDLTAILHHAISVSGNHTIVNFLQSSNEGKCSAIIGDYLLVSNLQVFLFVSSPLLCHCCCDSWECFRPIFLSVFPSLVKPVSSNLCTLWLFENICRLQRWKILKP